jgi:gas vesicle protein
MKYEESEYESSSASWLMAFVLGGLLGAAAALLFAPKSGRQTREQIKDIAQEAREKAGTYYDEAKDRISDVMQKGAEVFHQKKEEVKSEVAEVVK